MDHTRSYTVYGMHEDVQILQINWQTHTRTDTHTDTWHVYMWVGVHMGTRKWDILPGVTPQSGPGDDEWDSREKYLEGSTAKRKLPLMITHSLPPTPSKFFHWSVPRSQNPLLSLYILWITVKEFTIHIIIKYIYIYIYFLWGLIWMKRYARSGDAL